MKRSEALRFVSQLRGLLDEIDSAICRLIEIDREPLPLTPDMQAERAAKVAEVGVLEAAVRALVARYAPWPAAIDGSASGVNWRSVPPTFGAS